MAADEKWYFAKEQLQNTPSRMCGFDADKELSYRQQAANFIQDMGQKLQVSQLCINTAIVYMHRFYMFHSFTHFPWNTIAAASFFLAAKVEEQPRKLEHVIRVANICLYREQSAAFDAKSEQYATQSQDLVFNENVLLQTLGFDVAIDHPHTHVVRCCHLVRASKDLAQTSYFMASNSLHLTTMCLQYKPTVVACFCIHLACKWSNWQIPKSNENKDWFYYVDKTVTSELLEQLTTEFLVIFDKCPSRLKKKILSISNLNHSMDQMHVPITNSPFDTDCKKVHVTDTKDTGPSHLRAHHDSKQGLLATPDDPYKKSQRPHEPSTSQQQRIDHREYKEKKERERLEREKAQQHGKMVMPVNKHMPPGGIPPNKPTHNHHRPPMDPKLMKHHRPSGSREEVRDVRDGLPHRDHRETNNRDAQKREYVPQRLEVKPEVNDVKTESAVEKQRYDTNRPKVVDPKLQVKHDINRHRPDLKAPYPKRPDVQVMSSDVNKKPVVASNTQDKQNNFVKQSNSTSQRHKSPFSDVPKSVPTAAPHSIKQESRNGNHNIISDQRNCKPWMEVQPMAEDPSLSSPPPVTKRMPSLFSPEKTSPQKKSWNTKTPPNIVKKTNETPQTPVMQNSVPPPVSPFGSPVPKMNSSLKRHRSSSSGSEPELRPVVKKLDQISGFENIIRDSKMGIKLQVPDIIQPICDRQESPLETTSISKELKPPEIIKPFNTSLSEVVPLSQPLVNGIETNPALISNLLKESAPVNQLPVVDAKLPDLPAPSVPVINSAAVIDVEKQKADHHHKSEKKKKKDKHKHKDKDKSKDEKKKKHKDKDKERHKIKEGEDGGFKITITKDKIQPQTAEPASGLKVKISKDRLKPDIPESNGSNSSGSLKIKIPKEAIQPYNSAADSTRKRERDKVSPTTGPSAKVAKMNYQRVQDTRQNGRTSYNKVAQLGDGEASQLRLAESKYHIKGASKTS